jgi:ornithine cyclodeaminase/alanine dehydrogenase-like protein (mu-crystallin family)
LTVCDLTGVGAQDVAAANLVMDHAGDRGQLIEL